MLIETCNQNNLQNSSLIDLSELLWLPFLFKWFYGPEMSYSNHCDYLNIVKWQFDYKIDFSAFGFCWLKIIPFTCDLVKVVRATSVFISLEYLKWNLTRNPWAASILIQFRMSYLLSSVCTNLLWWFRLFTASIWTSRSDLQEVWFLLMQISAQSSFAQWGLPEPSYWGMPLPMPAVTIPCTILLSSLNSNDLKLSIYYCVLGFIVCLLQLAVCSMETTSSRGRCTGR